MIKNEVNKICKVHKCKMEKKDVSIMYGMPIGPVIGYSDAKDLLFPNCDDILLGGCVVRDGQKSKKSKYVCEQCNKERKKWKKLHRSEIIFETSVDIKENIVLVLNNEIIEIDKTNIHENSYINCLSLPNGNYQIIVRNKNTGKNITSLEIVLKKEYANINIFIDEEKNISIEIENKHKVFALWY